ncbi:MAG: sigma factor-like helix-turn-helix DNA-binding protein [Syntrophales bacterium]|nr:sigma factor-like helix-turn-helix DNA-binding protein [Syntrophales bacterium]
MKESKFDYKKLVQNLLRVIPQRAKEVIDRRYGISSGKEETLQEIGESWKITRERVRQIESWGFNLLKNSSEFKSLDPAFQFIKNYLDAFGGARKEQSLFYDLTSEQNHSALRLLLELTPGVERVQEDGKFFTFWSLGKNPQGNARKTADTLISKFKKTGQPMEEGEIEKFFQQESPRLFGRKIPKEALFSYFEISKEIRKGVFNKIGLASWPEITPRGVKDEAYLAFRKEEKPIHFSELTELINKNFHSGVKCAQVQTVHNELIKDPRFILIGRGIYALKEWGYEPGVVKEVITKVLKENKQPLSKNEIVDKVLKHRIVKKNTILFNLQDRNSFIKMDDGKYQLA